MSKVVTKRVVGFILEANKVLLGKKKRGHGAGYFIGIGGKIERDETADQALRREVKEEIEVDTKSIEQIGEINFFFETQPSWNQKVLVFKINSTSGKPKETDEIAPQWFDIEAIPYEKMWMDAPYWLPLVFDEKVKEFKGDFYYQDESNLESYQVEVKF